MTMSLTGFGIMSLNNFLVSSSLRSQNELRSILCVLVILVVVIVLAYLTNPSESSFRSYLTEQSFRQHLSRLDEDHEPSDSFADGQLTSPSPSPSPSAGSCKRSSSTTKVSSASERTTLPFHFANRASVSLRTPKHVFHTFGIFTIATTQGASMLNEKASSAGTGAAIGTTNGLSSGHAINNGIVSVPPGDNSQEAAPAPDTWFIGAFGKWWQGGVIESWYHDMLVTLVTSISRSKSATDAEGKAGGVAWGREGRWEGWSSGILGFKALDRLGEINGLSFSNSKQMSPLPLPTQSQRLTSGPRNSPPKLRNRERERSQLARRSSTPPPLPKSVSLPLHTDRRQQQQQQQHSQQQPHSPHPPSHQLEPSQSAPDHASGNGHVISPSPSTLSTTDQASVSPVDLNGQSSVSSSQSTQSQPSISPAVAEVLRQISTTKSQIQTLQSQLGSTTLSQSPSSLPSTQPSLQALLDTCRAKKREEDASRAEMKGRVREMEEKKRDAETRKREVERRLKNVEGQKDTLVGRIDELDGLIAALLRRKEEDERRLRERVECQQDGEKGDTQGVEKMIEEKRGELDVGEDVVAALSSKVRQLEDIIGQGRARLRIVKERADAEVEEQRRWDVEGTSPWPVPMNMVVSGPAYTMVPDIDGSQSGSEHIVAGSREVSRSPRPTSRPSPPRLSLGSLSNFHSHHGGDGDMSTLRQKGYAIFDEDIASVAQAQAPFMSSVPSNRQFLPFGPDGLPFHSNDMPTTPMPSTFIPTGLIRVLDGPTGTTPVSGTMARSFQSDNDPILERDWRSMRVPAHHTQEDNTGTFAASPISSNPASSTTFSDYDPFEVRMTLHAQSRSQTHLPYRTRSEAVPQPGSLGEMMVSSAPALGGVIEDVSTDLVIETDQDKAPHRRWFSNSSSSKETDKDKANNKKGLNPDAKVFRLPMRKILPSAFLSSSQQASTLTSSAFPLANELEFDALNPSSLNPIKNSVATSSTPNSLLRAFAPSPAEREALKRALGGSTNTSLERLPSLSDVGSIPSSPAPSVQLAAKVNAPVIGGSAFLPAWMQSLPVIKKPKFSPWEDEEATELEARTGRTESE